MSGKDKPFRLYGERDLARRLDVKAFRERMEGLELDAAERQALWEKQLGPAVPVEEREAEVAQEVSALPQTAERTDVMPVSAAADEIEAEPSDVDRTDPMAPDAREADNAESAWAKDAEAGVTEAEQAALREVLPSRALADAPTPERHPEPPEPALPLKPRRLTAAMLAALLGAIVLLGYFWWSDRAQIHTVPADPVAVPASGGDVQTPPVEPALTAEPTAAPVASARAPEPVVQPPVPNIHPQPSSRAKPAPEPTTPDASAQVQPPQPPPPSTRPDFGGI